MLPFYPSVGLLSLSCVSYLFWDDIGHDDTMLKPGSLVSQGKRSYLCILLLAQSQWPFSFSL